jgi:hypothetical protein
MFQRELYIGTTKKTSYTERHISSPCADFGPRFPVFKRNYFGTEHDDSAQWYRKKALYTATRYPSYGKAEVKLSL